jgi:phosphoglycerate dehydrogenase-like enzyme
MAAKRVCPPAMRLDRVGADPTTLTAALVEADALVDASMAVRITDSIVSNAPRLKVISCATTGSDHIDRFEISRRGVLIFTLAEDKELLRGLTAAAELTWGLILACARRIIPAARSVLDGDWSREAFPGPMLRGRRLGIVGCGRIGQWIAAYGNAFGMQVSGYDPYLDAWPRGISPVSLDTIATTSDVVSVHVHLFEETHGLINASFLSSMKRDAILVNTSRGSIVDEQALLAALAGGNLAAAGLDVLDGEPDTANHPLVQYARSHDNVIVTPHIGGFSPDAVALASRRATEKVVEQLALA